MTEKPIERLNYYNGQRLEASDLKLEQEYHIRVRRWLNKSLYSPGIARGLEVKAEKGTLNVIISPGLALDFEGREIILLEEERIPVIGKHNIVGTEDVGSYLTIQYREQTSAEEEVGCVPRNKASNKNGNRLAWKGPTRVLAKPTIGWSDILPHESSGKIVIARVVLDHGCQEVKEVDRNVRIYVREAGTSIHRSYALEGEKDIDPGNSKKIYFHIHGRRPNAVTLYLRAEKFSTLYYTEIGKHSHPLDIKLDNTPLPAHRHTLDLHTNHEPGHRHRITAWTSPYGGDIKNNEFGSLTTEQPHQDVTRQRVLTPSENPAEISVCGMDVVPNAPHAHTINEKETGDLTSQTTDIKHTVKTKNTEEWGNGPPARQGGIPLEYVSDLQVVMDGTNYTQELLANLGWNKFGDGSGNHLLVTNGTGPIPLGRFGDLDVGEHIIELKVTSGGGRILYNLYVE